MIVSTSGCEGECEERYIRKEGMFWGKCFIAGDSYVFENKDAVKVAMSQMDSKSLQCFKNFMSFRLIGQ